MIILYIRIDIFQSYFITVTIELIKKYLLSNKEASIKQNKKVSEYSKDKKTVIKKKEIIEAKAQIGINKKDNKRKNKQKTKIKREEQ